MITWNPTYSVQNAEIDQQHQKLLALLGELETAMLEGRGAEILGNTLDQVLEYTDYHFSTEEALMSTHRYPNTELHLAQHEEFKAHALDLHQQYAAGQRALAIDTLTFLCEWMLYHILSTDKEFGSFLSAKGVGT